MIRRPIYKNSSLSPLKKQKKTHLQLTNHNLRQHKRPLGHTPYSLFIQILRVDGSGQDPFHVTFGTFTGFVAGSFEVGFFGEGGVGGFCDGGGGGGWGEGTTQKKERQRGLSDPFKKPK